MELGIELSVFFLNIPVQIKIWHWHFISSTSNRFTIFFNDSYKWLRAKCFRVGQCEWRHRIPFSHLFGNGEVSIGLTRVLGRHSRCPISVTNVLLITIPLFLERDGPERYIVNHIFDIVVFYVIPKADCNMRAKFKADPTLALAGRSRTSSVNMYEYYVPVSDVDATCTPCVRNGPTAIAMRTPGKRECGAISLAKANH